jgi:hypothetical protein
MPLLTQPVGLKKSIPHRELQYHRGQDCFGLLTIMTGAASAPRHNTAGLSSCSN